MKIKNIIPAVKKFISGDELANEIKNTVSSEDLAPLVKLIAERIAEDINSSGVSEQMKFIEANGWEQEEIVKYVLEHD